jgi:hypothetical protein
MRNARLLLLLMATALMGMAFATPVPAQTLEATSEATDDHCSAVSVSGTDVNNGCLLHATSEGGVELRKHIFGIESHITQCNNEFHARLDEDATGYIFEQILNGAGCTRQACKDVGGEQEPWLTTGTETSGAESLTSNMCVETIPSGTNETCEITLPLDYAAGGHAYEVGQPTEISSHGITGFRCELIGHWNTEVGGTHDGSSETAIEIVHALKRLEFKKESNNLHCPVVQALPHEPIGGCLLHVSGELTLWNHVMGVEQASHNCLVEFKMRIDERGSGYAYHHTFTAPDGKPCSLEPCNEEAQALSSPWAVILSREVASYHGKQERVGWIMCTTPLDTHNNSPCWVDLPLAKLTGHQLEWGANEEIDGQGNVGNRCEVIAHFQTENSFGAIEDVELQHLPGP